MHRGDRAAREKRTVVVMVVKRRTPNIATDRRPLDANQARTRDPSSRSSGRRQSCLRTCRCHAQTSPASRALTNAFSDRSVSLTLHS